VLHAATVKLDQFDGLSSGQQVRPHERGVYGLRVRGLPGAEEWMLPQNADAPVLEMVAVRADSDLGPSHLDSTSADIALVNGARLRARSAENVIRYSVPSVPSDADLLHPYLAPGAALVWQWRGCEALHSGVFATRAGAVLLFGEKGSGKSTTLAWLAEHRSVSVIADDLAVISSGRVLTGPRCIDLRTAPTCSGVAVRDGSRIRIGLAQAPSPLRPAGAAVLSWGEELVIAALSARERLSVLSRQRTYPGLPADHVTLLDLASLPMVSIVRPRDPSALPAVSDAMLDRFS
jgi:hypothetical protein